MTAKQSPIRLAFIAAAAVASTACSMAAPTLQETRQLRLSVSPETLLAIDAGAGSLSLRGEPDMEAIEVEAEIWQVSPNDDYTLKLEIDESGMARLLANTGAGANRDRIDLDIRVPASIRLDVTDGSGSIHIGDLAGPINVDDGSGSIGIEDIGADITIEDGSGSLRVENTGGNLRIDDGSGSITVRNSAGDVTLDDGSGSISVTDTAGIVTIVDGSGSINVDGAQDFKLLDDGSGSVDLDNIRGAAKPDS